MYEEMTRRQVLTGLGALGIGGIAFQRALAHSVALEGEVTAEMIKAAQWIADVELDEDQQAKVASEVQKLLQGQKALQAYPIDADVVPAMAFVPAFFANPPLIDRQRQKNLFHAEAPSNPHPYKGIDDPKLPFASIAHLAEGLRKGHWTSRQLTKLYLDRLSRYDSVLRCVIQRTEDLAWEQADRADRELKSGQERGPLHGIPWVAKDIIAVPPYPTTWGAAPYRNQVRPQPATVYERLVEAGAVLLAKVSVGTLAWGEVWHDGVTKNPWNIAEGSSGSSAGSASATVAGLCGFSIGSETLGSIVSPTQRCRVTGLRPTFGRVSRFGCMALAWSMDKLGPICRNVEDCALVFAAILGADGKDPCVIDQPFSWKADSNTSWKIGYNENQLSEQEKKALEVLKENGCELVPIEYSNTIPESALLDALSAEASTAHEDLIRSEAKESDFGKWGPTFRQSQWIRAIHYLRGMRARSILIQETEAVLQKVDVVLGTNDLGRTNLTGHPSIVVAVGTRPNRIGDAPGTIKLTSRMFGDDRLLSVGHWLQKQMPPLPVEPPLERWLDEAAKAASDSSNEKDQDK
ncbi:MAG: amidase [Pirellulales bacterium]